MKRLRVGSNLHDLADYAYVQINDTHPSMVIPELIRLLTEKHKIKFAEAVEIVRNMVGYTNHTILAEALEKWPVSLFQPILPRIYSIIEEINRRFCLWVMEQGKQYSLRDTAIIYDDMIKMAKSFNRR